MRDKTQRLTRSKAGLLVIDIQEKLLPAIFEKERLVRNSVLLMKGLNLLKVPVFSTEQYRKGLGLTVPAIASAIEGFAPIEKVTFSACGAAGLMEMFAQRGITNLILCGMEAHVCVLQTCLDLLDSGRRVFVAADAVSSRTAENYRLGLERMRDAGAVIASSEMALFELLGRAATDEFKQVLGLVR
jgi:nicotinamidase-related amidase